MEGEKAEALLRPWLGDAVLKDLPVPQLVSVELDPVHPASAADLRAALAAGRIDATVDDHRRWQKDVEDAAGLVRMGTLAIFVLTAGAAAAVVAFAVRAGGGAASVGGRGRVYRWPGAGAIRPAGRRGRTDRRRRGGGCRRGPHAVRGT
jgi:cell division transport system permease protein